MNLIINNKKIPIKYAKTWNDKLRGLMFLKKINYGLLIPQCISIHTFGMKDNIDLIFLNEKKAVMYIFQNLKANKIIQVNEDINKTSALELPKNTSLNLKIGDILTFEFEDVI